MMTDKYVVYTAANFPDCPACEKAKNLLAEFNIQYDEIVIGRDLTKMEFQEKYGPSVKTVPQIVINGQRIGGYDALKERFSRG